ncbi:MAG: methyltransferase domain-containing protein [Waddliaceae bacterium]
MKQRSTQPEWLDTKGYDSLEEYHDCLEKLDRVGRWLSGDRATFKALAAFPQAKTVLDVGCGGGFFAYKLAKKHPHLEVTGIDTNPDAIAFANTLSPPLSNLSFEVRSRPQLAEPANRFDIIMTTLVCHHMKDEELTQFLRQAFDLARQGVVINDLHRHIVPYHAFKMLAPIFFRNRIVQHDGPLSIQRAFTRADWLSYLHSAGIPEHYYNIQWRWAFRWVVIIRKTSSLLGQALPALALLAIWPKVVILL